MDLIPLALATACAALFGGVGGALVAAVSLRGEGDRWDARVNELRSEVEDLEARWLSWQRRANKRSRDASGATEGHDRPADETYVPNARTSSQLMALARQRGIVR